MNLILHTETDESVIKGTGGKAKNLFKLHKAGYPVPKWVVVPYFELRKLLPELEELTDQQKIKIIQDLDFPVDLIIRISEYFENKPLSVRSSASEEDGYESSFAGMFVTKLYITSNGLADAIKQVWISAYSNRVTDYKQVKSLTGNTQMSIIIQEMIPAEKSGVAFGINPVTGNNQEKVINAVFGLGEGLVNGSLIADTYYINDQRIKSHIPKKLDKVVAVNDIVKTIPLEEVKQNIQVLNEGQIWEITKILNHLNKIFDHPQDIEFSILNGKIWMLQSRPATTTKDEKKGNYILWDNSNIIESYPGIVSPLTFSFISKSYESAYKLFCLYLGVSPDIIQKNETVFANTLGRINGRVYYNLKSWYLMLAMLPGYSINARFMEKMMGVKEQFDIPDDYRINKTLAWWKIVKMMVQMYGRYLTLKSKRKKFHSLVNNTIAHYKNIPFEEKSAFELMQIYREFEAKLLNEWKAPLLNDFFAMIWFGLLEKKTKSLNFTDNPNIHNDLLCGSSDIISTQPIHYMVRLSTQIFRSSKLKTLFQKEDAKFIWNSLSLPENNELKSLKAEIDDFLNRFGERCVGELKLETISYVQDPEKLIKVIQSYVNSGITEEKTSGKIEEGIRKDAEKEIQKLSLLQRIRLKRLIRNTRTLVSARENLRFQRTRAFGMVRVIFTWIGQKFYDDDLLDDARDIFYLSSNEIFSIIEGRSITSNLKSLIEMRKSEELKFAGEDAPPERFATYGIPYFNSGIDIREEFNPESELIGVGCCPGVIKGKARVVINPDEECDLNGDILVTSSTDPGWVKLFPHSSAILVERGSLLSHSAIVSREMGIPCIVGITNLLKHIKTGDEILLNGSTGIVKILNKNE